MRIMATSDLHGNLDGLGTARWMRDGSFMKKPGKEK